MTALVMEEVKKAFNVKIFVLVSILLILGSLLHVFMVENISLDKIQASVEKSEAVVQEDYSSDPEFQEIAAEQQVIAHYSQEHQVERPDLFWDYMNNNIVLMNAILFICIYFASTVFAKEFSGKTIRNLVMLPFSKSGIYLAKITAVSLFTLACTAMSCLVSAGMAFLFFSEDFSREGVYLVLRDGVVEEYSAPLYTLLRFSLKGLEILAVSLFALIVSVLVRNYIVSLIVTFAVVFMGDTLVLLFADTSQLIKYSLFANIDYLSYLSGSVYMNNPTLFHSLGVTMIYLLLLYKISLILFEKKDIF